jgi:organic radical activating enzyme
MKIFPIRVERTEPNNYKTVEWMLHNVCNYNCSFCPASTKDGSKRWLDLQVYKDTCKRAIIEAGTKPVWFKLTGGEPTLYPKIAELLKFIKDNGGFTYIISNGSRTIRFWKELVDQGTLDFLALTYHPEQSSDYQHIIDVTNVFVNSPTFVTVNITSIPEFFDKAVFAGNEILNKCATIVNLQQINDEQNMLKYSEEQIKILLKYNMVRSKLLSIKKRSLIPKEFLYHSGKIQVKYNDGSTITDHAGVFIKKGETFFYGWECDIGQELIRIEHETVSRAVCGQGDRWSIYDKSLFASDSLICKQSGQCTCTLDVIEPKRMINTVCGS